VQTENFIELTKLSTGSKMPRADWEILSNSNIIFPTLPEQTKIGNFLTAVDTKIQGLRKEKDLLEQYKKGMMQRIFSQTLRFKDADNQDFPNWEMKKLGEIAKFSKGKGVSKNDIIENGKTECIRYGELYTVYNETISEVKSRTNVELKNLVLSEANDVIIPSSGESELEIATASCVLKSGVALGGDLNIIKTKNNGVFLSYYLNNIKKYDISKLAQGTSVVHLYSTQLALLDLNLPTLPEQTKIANFLTAIDEKISNCAERLEKMEVWKKGLLQQMFV
jgi:type I restriction enzyme S subunit